MTEFIFSYDEIYDFWTAWARESSGLGIVIGKKQKNTNIVSLLKI